MPERDVPRQSRFFHGPMEKKLIFFGIFGVRHANQGRTKYSIYTNNPWLLPPGFEIGSCIIVVSWQAQL